MKRWTELIDFFLSFCSCFCSVEVVQCIEALFVHLIICLFWKTFQLTWVKLRFIFSLARFVVNVCGVSVCVCLWKKSSRLAVPHRRDLHNFTSNCMKVAFFTVTKKNLHKNHMSYMENTFSIIQNLSIQVFGKIIACAWKNFASWFRNKSAQ